MFEWMRRLHYRCHRHRRNIRVILVVDGYAFELHPHWRICLMIQVNVGHSVDCSIEYLDQNNNPMLTTPIPDSPPTWTDTPATPPVDTFTVAPGGLTAVLAATAPGADTVNLSVTVGGQTFTATLGVAISAVPQVLTSVQIQGTVV